MELLPLPNPLLQRRRGRKIGTPGGLGRNARKVFGRPLSEGTGPSPAPPPIFWLDLVGFALTGFDEVGPGWTAWIDGLVDWQIIGGTTRMQDSGAVAHGR